MAGEDLQVASFQVMDPWPERLAGTPFPKWSNCISQLLWRRMQTLSHCLEYAGLGQLLTPHHWRQYEPGTLKLGLVGPGQKFFTVSFLKEQGDLQS